MPRMVVSAGVTFEPVSVPVQEQQPRRLRRPVSRQDAANGNGRVKCVKVGVEEVKLLRKAMGILDELRKELLGPAERDSNLSRVRQYVQKMALGFAEKRVGMSVKREELRLAREVCCGVR